MNIIIVGDGKVGYTLAEHLSKEEHNITIIDKNIEALKRADETLDVMCVKGNGASANVLIEAGVSECDVVIAATSRDEMNMICCFIAKKLGAVKTIARIRDPEYYEEFTVLRKEMGIDMVINPERSCAQEIANILQFPAAMNIEHFVNGKVRMVEFRVMADDKIVGTKVSKPGIKLPQNVLIAAVERDGEVYIPRGDFTFEEDDRVYVMGQLTGVINFFKELDRYVQRINSVLITGGGRMSYYLTKIVSNFGMSVKIIEIDQNKCEILSETLPEAMIIHGDGTDQDLLEAENMEEIDAFVAMTGRDEENLITAMYAVEQGVHKVIAKTTRVNFPRVIDKLGLDSIISPKMTTVSYIIGYVRGLQNSAGSAVETLHKIVDGNAEVLSFIANETTNITNIPIKSLKLKSDLLITCIVHRNEVIIPHGNEMIQNGDRVFVITKSDHMINELNNIVI